MVTIKVNIDVRNQSQRPTGRIQVRGSDLNIGPCIINLESLGTFVCLVEETAECFSAQFFFSFTAGHILFSTVKTFSSLHTSSAPVLICVCVCEREKGGGGGRERERRQYIHCVFLTDTYHFLSPSLN